MTLRTSIAGVLGRTALAILPAAGATAPAHGAKVIDEKYKGLLGWEQLYGSRAQWKSADSIWPGLTINALEAAYSCHPIVRACVDAKAETAAEPRIELGMEVNQEWKPVKAHPLLDLLEYPNEHMNQTDLIRLLTMRLQLTAWGFGWKMRGARMGRIAELWPMPSSWVTPIIARQGTSLFSGFRIAGNKDLAPPEDMMVARLMDPCSSTGASAPLQSALHDYWLDKGRENFQAEVLENLKLPGLVMMIEGLTDAQANALRERLEERFGAGNRGLPLVMRGKGSMQIPNPMADLDWPGLTHLSETRICTAFGVPPIVIHCRAGLEKATYSNYEQAERAFYRRAMGPLWELLADVLTLHLCRREGEMKLRFRFRYDELPQFTEDRLSAAQRASIMYQGGMGIASRDEARAELGLPPDPTWEAPTPPPDPNAPADDDDEERETEDEEEDDDDDAAA